MSEAVEEYAKEYVREKQAVNVKNIMEDTGFTVEQALDEADLLAENSNERMTHEEVYRCAEEQSNNSFYTPWHRRNAYSRIQTRHRSQGNWL